MDGQHTVLAIPVCGDINVAIGELHGQTMKLVEDRLVIVEARTDHARNRINKDHLIFYG